MTNSIPLPSDDIFPDDFSRAIAVNTIVSLKTIHESILEGANLFHQAIIRSIVDDPAAFVKYIDLYNEEDFANRYTSNIDYSILISENFVSKSKNNEVNRYEYDLLVLELYSVAIDAMNVTKSCVEMVIDNFVFENDNYIIESDIDAFGKIIDDCETAAVSFAKVYGGLNWEPINKIFPIP